MKKIGIFLFVLFLCPALFSQTAKKVAVFNPEGNVTESIRHIVREEISNAIVNTPNYSVVERSMIENVLAESEFQMSGLVDDQQISELGRMMGANYVCYGSIQGIGNNYYLSLKMVDVITAGVIMQRTGVTQDGINDLISVTENLAYQLVNITGRESEKTVKAERPRTIPGSKKVVLVGVRPEPDDPIATTISDHISDKLSQKYSVKVSPKPLTGTVGGICKSAVENHQAGYVVLVTLSYSGRTFDYRAELFDTSTGRRVFPIEANKLSRRDYSEQHLAEEIWRVYERELSN